MTNLAQWHSFVLSNVRTRSQKNTCTKNDKLEKEVEYVFSGRYVKVLDSSVCRMKFTFDSCDDR